MTETLNDKEKLDLWNQVCIEHGWSSPRELEKWLLHSGIKFSNSGSAVPDQVMMLMNKYNLDIVVKAVEGEGLATLILEALTGTLTFSSTELEKLFWSKVDSRLREEYDSAVPVTIVPNYVKNGNNPHQYELFE